MRCLEGQIWMKNREDNADKKKEKIEYPCKDCKFQRVCNTPVDCKAYRLWRKQYLGHR